MGFWLGVEPVMCDVGRHGRRHEIANAPAGPHGTADAGRTNAHGGHPHPALDQLLDSSPAKQPDQGIIAPQAASIVKRLTFDGHQFGKPGDLGRLMPGR